MSEAGIPEAAKIVQRRPMDERRRFLIRVIQLMRYTLRGYFGESFADKWGFFVDRNMSTEIHSFADWIEYPKGNHIFMGNGEPVWSAVITGDGCYLFTGSSDGRIFKWDLRFNAKITDFQAHPDAVYSLVHARSKLISAGGEGTIKVWNDEDYSLIQTMDGHSERVSCLSVNQRGTTLISGSFDNTCRVWSLKSGECIRVMTGHTNWIQNVILTDDLRIISGSWDKSITLWNGDSGKSLRNITAGISGVIWDLSLNSDASMLVCCFRGGLSIFKYPSMKVLSTLYNSSNRCCFHPLNPNILAVSEMDDYTVKLYSIDQYSECISTMKDGHVNSIRCIRFSPDGYRLITTSDDESVQVWDVVESK